MTPMRHESLSPLHLWPMHHRTSSFLFRRLLLSSTIPIDLALGPSFRAQVDEVSSNGGDRINKKIQQWLRRMADGVPGASDLVGEATPKKGKRAKVKGEEEGMPSKRAKKHKARDSEEGSGHSPQRSQHPPQKRPS